MKIEEGGRRRRRSGLKRKRKKKIKIKEGCKRKEKPRGNKT